MARRQEQESARAEVTEVAPSVLRMELPIHMPGLGHVNCYALVDSRGVALVDPGLPGPITWRALQDRLRQAGLEVRHVHTVVVTHSHPDHFGCAARLAREAGAEIVAHHSFSFGPVRTEPDAEVSVEDLAAQAESDVAREEEAEPKAPTLPPAPAGRTPWGGERPRPPLRMRMRLRLMRLVGRSFLPKITRPVDHGDVLELGGREWFVLHTPGHTQDHFCLHDPDAGILLAGDHVLPTITPHISGFNSTPDPLKSYFYSLDRVGEIAGVKQALPAHGHPFADLRARTEAIKRHHLERLEKVKEISRELGPATVGAISRRLFAQRSWGAMAESETYAHLEHLRHAGEAECHREGNGKLVYVAG
jgi:glyoxylase-like metal-dependent hydrolase (beta-lactamase superfamily II)